ncbi:hypothetical protein, conserved [Leishmania tarentolae]|uniref:Uncharacterized protein n=1 Tax=Leishmania tarentolae TaxID=5689 RepID=A0A640KTE2_LEITA|nr:hypothetical protein, conserved [Leishmania tarentolae]
MELGKLVTTESRGCIYYFIIDDVHPDEPQHDALKYYYVVTTTLSSFSYREAYGVLCRALCSLDNRTFLHRWHSLYEQIFGTTPYVQFVDTVRNSPPVYLDTLPPPNEGGNCNANGDAAAAKLLPLASAAGKGSAGPSSFRICAPGTVALFSNEASARLALGKMMGIDLERPHSTPNGEGVYKPHHHNGCCTPVDALHTANNDEENHQLSVPQQPLLNGSIGGTGCAYQVKAKAGFAVIDDRDQPQHKLNDLLSLTSRWRVGECSAADANVGMQDLQRQLEEERKRRMKAEQHHRLLSRMLNEKSRESIGERQTGAAAAPSTQEQEGRIAELRKELRALQQQLSEENARHSKQREELVAENEQLKRQLGQQQREQSARIEKFLKENEDAVNRMEDALHKREEEVRAVYTQALQERDVRIAQLSQEVLQHTHEARQLASLRSDEERLHARRAGHFEDIAVQLREWNLSLQRQLADANNEVQQLRQRLEVMNAASMYGSKDCACLSGDVSRELAGGVFPCDELSVPHVAQLATQLYHSQQLLKEFRDENKAKSRELMHAAQLIDALKEGLRRVKLDLGGSSPASAAANAMPPSSHISGEAITPAVQLPA